MLSEFCMWLFQFDPAWMGANVMWLAWTPPET